MVAGNLCHRAPAPQEEQQYLSLTAEGIRNKNQERNKEKDSRRKEHSIWDALLAGAFERSIPKGPTYLIARGMQQCSQSTTWRLKSMLCQFPKSIGISSMLLFVKLRNIGHRLDCKDWFVCRGIWDLSFNMPGWTWEPWEHREHRMNPETSLPGQNRNNRPWPSLDPFGRQCEQASLTVVVVEWQRARDANADRWCFFHWIIVNLAVSLAMGIACCSMKEQLELLGAFISKDEALLNVLHLTVLFVLELQKTSKDSSRSSHKARSLRQPSVAPWVLCLWAVKSHGCRRVDASPRPGLNQTATITQRWPPTY